MPTSVLLMDDLHSYLLGHQAPQVRAISSLPTCRSGDGSSLPVLIQTDFPVLICCNKVPGMVSLLSFHLPLETFCWCDFGQVIHSFLT
jgi:hypothetical protein